MWQRSPGCPWFVGRSRDTPSSRLHSAQILAKWKWKVFGRLEACASKVCNASLVHPIHPMVGTVLWQQRFLTGLQGPFDIFRQFLTSTLVKALIVTGDRGPIFFILVPLVPLDCWIAGGSTWLDVEQPRRCQDHSRIHGTGRWHHSWQRTRRRSDACWDKIYRGCEGICYGDGGAQWSNVIHPFLVFEGYLVCGNCIFIIILTAT